MRLCELIGLGAVAILSAPAQAGYLQVEPLDAPSSEVEISRPTAARGTGGACSLLFHSDGTYESAYAWDFDGVQLPNYGAFAERYEGTHDICGVVLDLTTVSGAAGTADVFVWADGGGVPGAVLDIVTGWDPGPVSVWPAVSRHEVDVAVSCAGTPIWVGMWGAWPGAANAWFVAADLDGTAGTPQTNIAPGVGFPTGWNDVATVWGSTRSLGIGLRELECGTFGACCLPDDSCQLLTAPACSDAGGEFLGPGEGCTPNPCLPLGACCFDPLCTVTEQIICTVGGGIYHGDDSTCEPLPCTPIATGACCLGPVCIEVDECGCTAAGGIYVGDASVCTPDPCGGAPDISIDPTQLDFNIAVGGTDQAILTVSNLGASDLSWSVTEVEILLLDNGPTPDEQVQEERGGINGVAPSTGGQMPLVRSRSILEQSPLENAVSRSEVQRARRGGDLVPLTLDDGSRETDIGLTGGAQFFWFNRFTPAPSDFPFRMTEVQILFPTATSGVDVGELVDIYLYEDTDGDGDPGTGGVFLGSVLDAAVQANDGVTWSVYPFPPHVLHGPGDVLVGVVNRTAGTMDFEYPAALDATATLGRSWLAAYSAGPTNPPVLPGEILWGIIDDFVAGGGNWMVRGTGVKGGGDCAWLSVDVNSGTVPGGQQEQVIVSVDTAELPEGDYRCDLVFASNDPDEPEVTVTVLLLVAGATSGGGGPMETVPSQMLLFPATPNPSKKEFRLDFALPHQDRARIEVFDAQGRRVAKVLDETLPAGRHFTVWPGTTDDGETVPNGLYFYRLESGGRTAERKLLRVR